MGIISTFIIAGLVFGNSYLMFQGQMRNIGLLRTLAVLLIVPFPLNVPFIFGSNLKDGPDGVCAHMINSFNKNFFHNLLLCPFRVFSHASSSLWGRLTNSPVDNAKLFETSFGKLYLDAVEDVAKQEAEKEEVVRLRNGVEENVSERQQELDRKEAELAVRENSIKDKELNFASMFFAGCDRIDSSFEIKGVQFQDGSMIFSAPEAYRASVEESLKSYFAADGDNCHFTVVCFDDFDAAVRDAENRVLEAVGAAPNPWDFIHRAIETSDGKRFVCASDGNVAQVQLSLDRIGIDAKAVSDRKFDSLLEQYAGSVTEYFVGSYSNYRALYKDCSLYFSPVEGDITTREHLLGVAVSGREFREAVAKVEAFNEFIREGLSQKGVRGLLKGDSVHFDYGLQVMYHKDKDSVMLMYGDGFPIFVGEISFLPRNGEGREFEVSLEGLKEILSNGSLPDKESKSLMRAFEYGFGEKFESIEQVVSKMESLSGPELADVWCNSVKEPNNLSVLFEQQTLTGFKAVEYNAKVDEAKHGLQEKQLEVKVTETVKRDVSVKPKL